MKSVIVVLAILIPTAAVGQSGSFINAEYWSCPPENLGAFAQASDTIWGPFFDELVEEGKLSSWAALAPTSAISVVEEGGRRVAEDAEVGWNYVISWTAPNKEIFESAWAIFLERLVEKFPADPRPFLFCDSVKIVEYTIRGPQ